MKKIADLYISTKAELYLLKNQLRHFLYSLEYDQNQIVKISNAISKIGLPEIAEKNILKIEFAIAKYKNENRLVISFQTKRPIENREFLNECFDEIESISSEKGEPIILKVFKLLPNPDFYLDSKLVELSRFLFSQLSTDKMILEFKAKNDDLSKQVFDLISRKELLESALKSRSMFIAYLSHEIRTPMNGILGFTEILLKEKLNRRQYEFLRKIKNSGSDILNVVNDVLDFSKIEAGKLSLEKKPFNLTNMLEELWEFFSHQAFSKGLRFLIEKKTEGNNYLVGDSFRLKQVLMNLCCNAIKFTETGTIKILVELIKSNNQQVNLLFSVIDTGIGIKESVIESLFSPYVQAENGTSRKFGGTGLGLFICKQLVNLMGGEISVKSIPEKGSEFSFDLTFSIEKAQTKASTNTFLKFLRVLVVDPYLISGQLLSELLSTMRFDCETTAFGEQAIEILKQNAANEKPFDFVIIDNNMPFGLNGGQIAQKIKQDSIINDTKIIIISSYVHDPDIDNYLKYIDALLKKPISEIVLVDTIKKLYSTDGFYSEEIKNVSTDFAYYQALFKHCKILLADNSLINREIVTDLLTEIEVHLEMLTNEQKTIEKIQSEHWDAILIDVNLPEMDGLIASSEVRYLFPNGEVPIIAMIANIDDKEKCISAGMNDFIIKPFVPNELYKVLAKWVPQKKTTNMARTQKRYPALNNDLNALHLKGFDIKSALERVNGKSSLYIQLLRNFSHKYANLKIDFENALKANDSAKAKRFIHTLKGASGTIGAMKLYKISADFEKEIEMNSSDFINKKELFFSEFNKTINAIVGFGTHSVSTEKSDSKTVDSGKVVGLLNKLDVLLLTDIGEAINKCNELLDIFENTKYELTFSRFSEELFKFNIEAATIKLKNFQEEFLSYSNKH